MKWLLILFISTLSVPLLSCSRVELEKINLSNPVPILEISQDVNGAFDITGKSLFFRLYNDGLVEYEFPDDNKMVKGKATRDIEDIKSFKQLRLNDKKLQNFKRLLKNHDSPQIENQYERRCCCTDTSVNLAIQIKIDGFETNIGLRNFCDLSEIKCPQPRYVPNYPQVLSELLTLADNARVH